MRLLTGRAICSCLFAIIQAVAGEIRRDLWRPEGALVNISRCFYGIMTRNLSLSEGGEDQKPKEVLDQAFLERNQGGGGSIRDLR